jgi:hypothetical protein
LSTIGLMLSGPAALCGFRFFNNFSTQHPIPSVTRFQKQAILWNPTTRMYRRSFNELIENGKQTDLLILDFSKAFDKISHSLLLDSTCTLSDVSPSTATICVLLYKKVWESIGLLNLWFHSDRTYGVVGCDWLYQRLSRRLYSTVHLFADDTVVYLTVSSDSDCSKLQSDLDKLAKWENNWKMEFHLEKCTDLCSVI